MVEQIIESEVLAVLEYVIGVNYSECIEIVIIFYDKRIKGKHQTRIAVIVTEYSI